MTTNDLCQLISESGLGPIGVLAAIQKVREMEVALQAADELADADDTLTQLLQDLSFAKGKEKRTVNKQIEDAQRKCVSAWVKYRAARGN